MGQIVLDISNKEKGESLLNFLKQLEFIEIKKVIWEKEDMVKKIDNKKFEKILLEAPVLTEEELESIENVGREFTNWKIEKF